MQPNITELFNHFACSLPACIVSVKTKKIMGNSEEFNVFYDIFDTNISSNINKVTFEDLLKLTKKKQNHIFINHIIKIINICIKEKTYLDTTFQYLFLKTNFIWGGIFQAKLVDEHIILVLLPKNLTILDIFNIYKERFHNIKQTLQYTLIHFPGLLNHFEKIMTPSETQILFESLLTIDQKTTAEFLNKTPSTVANQIMKLKSKTKKKRIDFNFIINSKI